MDFFARNRGAHWFLLLLLCLPLLASAHPGGLNKQGCHNNRKTGEYHCHGGYSSGSGSTRSTSTASPTRLYSAPATAAAPKPTVTTTPAPFKSQPAATTLTGTVTNVEDGDTLTLFTVAGERVVIRLTEIDAPEDGQPWGEESGRALKDFVWGQTIKVETAGKDKYDRTLGRVYVGAKDVNASMVMEGHAWAFRKYLKDPAFLGYEAGAKTQLVGLWSLPKSQQTPPWEWRVARRK